MIAPQRYKYLLALDFEATCLKHQDIKPQEIIEFPCLKINTDTFEIDNTFHYYVRPVHHPQLSDHCIDKTGIKQENVEHALTFPEVLQLFEIWMETEGLLKTTYAFVTCGNWDFNVFLRNQCRTSQV